MQTERETELLNSFLRTELASVQSYGRVLSHTKEGETDLVRRVVEPLRRIQEDHREAARLLSAEIVERGNQPTARADAEPDSLDALAQVSGSALEDPYALKVLKEREEQALISYESVLKELDPELQHLVGDMLLPRTRDHLPVLSELLSAT